uniref:Glycosyltransferase RgtA/B/C/D-like domain-containing protein n=1 Tax=Thermosporothrix sp. COM3 TaxID=2490863 RepID=A0A455SQ75_9CHLR|nr:hypothetical protein KTC_40420 [Thermosporothrix sp. COM3]
MMIQRMIAPRLKIPKKQTSNTLEHYKVWLAKQAEWEKNHDPIKETEEYRRAAARIVRVRNKNVQVFVPFRPGLSAFQVWSRSQMGIACMVVLAGLAGVFFSGLSLLVTTIALITIVYALHLLLSFWMLARVAGPSETTKVDEILLRQLKDVEWPRYTVLCPLYREATVVPQLLRALKQLDYPEDKLQILLLTEEDDTQTRSVIRAQALPPHFHLVTVPPGEPRTKPRACNYGLMYATGSYIVIYDAEDVPDPFQLKKAVLAFASHDTEVVCVQARLNCYNAKQNLLTRWYTAEYSMWFDLILPGLQKLGLMVPLGGTSNHFRASVLRALGGWDAFNVTEDCDLGLRLSRCGFKTVVLDSTTYEEAVSQGGNWLRQRSRWIKGYFQTYFVHTRYPLTPGRRELRNLFSLHLLIGSGACMLFINPIMWALFLLYLFCKDLVMPFYHTLFPLPIFYLGIFCFAFGNFFYVYLYLLGCARRKLYALMPCALLIPLYWVGGCLAALLALGELVFRPHYWQKTTHGLHLKDGQSIQGYPPEERASATLKLTRSRTDFILPVTDKILRVNPLPMMLNRMYATLQTFPLPVFTRMQAPAAEVKKRRRSDHWLMVVLGTASVLSIASCGYFFWRRQILLYSEATIQLRLAHHAFESIASGQALPAGTWFSMPQVVMLPFIWNSYLWQTGLAGSLGSMLCYVCTACFLYLTIKRLTGRSILSYLGTLLFLLNPNMLYLQATPLAEAVGIATCTTTLFFFLAWVQEQRLRLLILSGACSLLAMMAHPLGWGVFLALLILLVVTGKLQRQSFSCIGSNLLLFGLWGVWGLVLWECWNLIQARNPLLELSRLALFPVEMWHTQGISPAFHHIGIALKIAAFAPAFFAGIVPVMLACIGIVLYVRRQKLTPVTLTVLTFGIVPFVFLVLALYTGQLFILLPDTSHASFHNVRFGSLLLVPVALFCALFCDSVRLEHWRPFSRIMLVIFALLILGQSVALAADGGVVLEERQQGQTCEPVPLVYRYLEQHYNGGIILQRRPDPRLSTIQRRNLLDERSGLRWKQALQEPERFAEWVVYDGGMKALDVKSARFRTHYLLLVQDTSGMQLFYKKGGPSLHHVARVVEQPCPEHQH